MRTFTAGAGETWVAFAQARAGSDYKGRYHLVMAPENGEPEDRLDLEDIRWNSERTAERTLQTMSESELRRRHRYALERKLH